MSFRGENPMRRYLIIAAVLSVVGLIVQEAFAQLISRYGEAFKQKLFDDSGQPKRFLNIYLNGKNISFIDNFESQLQEGDELTILPSVTGG